MSDPVFDEAEMHVPARVLLVEDDAIIAMNAQAMLSQMGVADVQSASSVAEALALIDAHDFDWGMLDFLLGDENCLPVAQRLCAAQIPVLITTGFLDIDLPDDCKAARILGKPYRFADLEREIARLTA